jgi:hypothetical protein
MPTPELTGRILTAAIEAIEGDERPGQTEMAAEVARTIDDGEPLLLEDRLQPGDAQRLRAHRRAALARSDVSRRTDQRNRQRHGR